MKRSILLGLLAISVALIPIVANEKVLGKSELIVQENNQENISTSPALGSIQTRNERITINPNKTYTIHNKDGEVVAKDMTLEELQANNPELHKIIEDSIAGETLMMDAGISTER